MVWLSLPAGHAVTLGPVKKQKGAKLFISVNGCDFILTSLDLFVNESCLHPSTIKENKACSFASPGLLPTARKCALICG